MRSVFEYRVSDPGFWPYLVVAGLFVISGIGFWDNILLFPRIAEQFGIDFPNARWVLALYSASYFVFALPSAVFHRKCGYKIGMVFALGLVSVGPFLIYPAFVQHEFAYFLGAVVLMGAGWSALETSLNPLVVELGQRKTAVRRLNFLQSFFPIGVVIGYVVGRWFYPSSTHASFNLLVESAARPYVSAGLAVLVLAFLVDKVKFPVSRASASGGIVKMRHELRDLWGRSAIKIGMAAIFCCIAIQSTLQGEAYRYVEQQYPGYTVSMAHSIVFLNLIIFGIGRFVGTALMGKFASNGLFVWSIGFGLALTIGAYVLGGVAGLVCLMATNLCLAIGYPTVFATTLLDLRSSASLASGLLVTSSALAGLVVPLAMNYLIEATDARMTMLMALPCFPMLFIYARHARSRAGLDHTGIASAPQV